MMHKEVFISYSRKDTEIAEKVCRALDLAGISYFIDRQGIGGGMEFPTVLAKAIKDCDIFLFLASKNSYESKFTNSEITFAFNEKPKNSLLLFIIDDSKLPLAMRFIFSGINWRNSHEHPIESVLVDDICRLLNKERTNGSRTNTLSFEESKITGNYVNPAEKEKVREKREVNINQLQKPMEGYDHDKAIDKLRSMKGMEKVISQLEDYIDAFKFSRDSRQGARFRPHLVFSGNPGTGKTTVARLLAEILREEGLLERGHFVEATVGDLEGEYIGQTRVKTKALCERARGGVLFIDEAYGLMSGSGHGDHADYGKEAIEVLIQFMENSSDSLVILAGYKEDMENLIQNGNKGFTRRFNGKESFVLFDDYPPEALYSIFQRQIKDMAVTDEFTISIKNIIHHLFAHRTATWGNAREMKKLASSILNLHDKNRADGLLDTSDIPEHIMRVISPVDSIDDILREVETLEGLNGVKQNLRVLVKSSIEKRKRAFRDPKMVAEKPNLNFAFTGAPGTGKTTVANLMAKILFTAGLINKSDKAVVVQKCDIIKSGIGETSKAIKKLFEDHAGEVIFIDEAYSLTQHCPEAIDEITNCLTDPRYMGNQAVILAGYTQEMGTMLKSNRGLHGRLNIWHFEDYTNDELWRIFLNRAKARGMRITDIERCRRLADEYFDEARRVRPLEFSNAREANQLFDIVRKNYYIREFKEDVIDMTILPQDFPNYYD